MAARQGQEGLDVPVYSDILKEKETPEVRDESGNTEYKKAKPGWASGVLCIHRLSLSDTHCIPVTKCRREKMEGDN